MAAAVGRQLRHDLFAKVEEFSNGEFDRFSTASLITRTTNDVQQIQMLVTMGVRMICYTPIIGIGGVIFAVQKSVSLSFLVALAVVVFLGLILVLPGRGAAQVQDFAEAYRQAEFGQPGEPLRHDGGAGLWQRGATRSSRFDAANRDLTGDQPLCPAGDEPA